jgi:hypothetical protein
MVASNQQEQVKPGSCGEQNVSHGCHDEGKENRYQAGPVIKPTSKCGTDRNAAQGKSGEKDSEFEWIHTPLIDREKSQVGAAHGITGADKENGDGDG